ncbi:hypothetical protein [Nocardioides hwasunensis]|uniref:Uncharacterized protein n=1 Tax=Nocardioides hwasunensis TaxID=397258 RepID=A0ABR8MGL6_9ACTN|nr:hypothetical protein [Nocardioides hwasunensis]MBD3915219.1 hypothetical protein [Nocardioides hwasunensis]
MTNKPAKAGILRLALLGAAASLVLAGCSNDPTPPDAAGRTTTGGASAPADPSSDGASGAGNGTRTSSPTDEPDSASATPGTGSTTGADPSGTASTDTSPGDTSPGNGNAQDDGGNGLEMPEAPEQTVTSLSELLGTTSKAPLVSAPLPRAASATGRLVSDFPTLLRPSRASRVTSSSISPSGSRLQVGLVATTALSPDDLLLAYRSRLARSGLGEIATPPTTPGSVAAAFRRGRSTITVTATEDGSRTTYSVHASLHTGSA